MKKDLVYQGNERPIIELKQGTSLTVRQINSVFHLGFWRFQADNQLIFQPITSLFQRLFPLTAIYTEFDKIHKFRAEQVLEFEQIFLDGIIQIEDNFLILDAIYSLSTPYEPLQIARIIQKLEPSSLTDRELAISSSMGSDENSAITNTEQIELEINSLQEIKNYSVILRGDTESYTFESLEAILYITFPSEREKPNHIQLSTKNIFELQHGHLNWNYQILESELDSDWYSLTEIAEDDSNLVRIKLNYQETIPTTNCVWYSRAENDLESNILPVMGEKITVDLTIDGDIVRGDINASGYYTDSLAPSNYQATIVGEIEKSKRVEELRQALDSENVHFTGCWLTKIPTIGEIKLRQYGNEVQGAYYPDGEYLERHIRGTVEGNFLEFNWTNGKQRGWGYFRSLNQGGILSGMWGMGDFPNQQRAIIANWQLPINVKTVSQEDELFLRELRWLGHELIHQQRFEQGVSILEEVIRLYRHQRHQIDISSQDELDFLHSEAFTLVGYILRCNIYSAKYHKLIGNLEHLIEVINLLSAEKSASRLFTDRTESFFKCLISFLETCHIFIEGSQRTKSLLEGKSVQGKVGIFLEQGDFQQNIIVNNVIENSPAQAVGMLPGDILVQIGETTVEDISLRESYDLLGGEPNSSVSIVIKRQDLEIKFDLIRQARLIYPLQRKNYFLEILDYFARYYLDLTNLIEAEFKNLEQLKLRIAEGKIDFLKAWRLLRNHLALFGETINIRFEELLTIKETLFIEYPTFLEDINLAISFVTQLRETTGNHNITNSVTTVSNNINPLEIDAAIDNFFLNNSDLFQIEIILFRCFLNSVHAVNNFYGEINLTHNFMTRVNVVESYKENQQSSRSMLSNLTQHIERWRAKLVEDLEKIDALEQAQPLFAKVLEMSVTLGDTKEALIFSEKSRARAFADLLATRFQEDVDRDFIDIPVNSPEITFEEIQHLAKSNSAIIVEYFIVSEDELEVIYIWVIQQNGTSVLKTVKLNSNSQQPSGFLSNLISKTRASFGIKDKAYSSSINSSFSKDKNAPSIDLSAKLKNSQTLLGELYQLLIKPIESYLNLAEVKKIILVPHGNLFLVPFASLFNPETREYLIEQYSIILSPAIQTLNLTQQNFASNSEAQNTLVVGNPKMPSLSCPAQALQQLPYAETAAKAISNLLETQPLLKEKATKKEILTQLPNARIIHFGTHGEINDTQPLQSWIALTPENEDRGFLTVEDIMNQFAPPQTASLSAELVVLSACQTGLGKITGDGVIGLARGLMATGVKAVLVSLWEVPDLSTACLMVRFYQYLQSGSTANEALKLAQIWLKNITNQELKTWMRQERLPLKTKEKVEVKDWLEQQKNQGNLYPFQHPFYWGAFYLIGA